MSLKVAHQYLRGCVSKMAVGKAVVVVVTLCLCLTSQVSGDKYDIKDGRHNITMGHRLMNPGKDILLFHDNLKIEGSWFPYPSVQSHDVCYPPKGSHIAKFSITAFNVTDQGKGAYAFIKSGGVGQGKLCLHLKTQRGSGYHFIVDIWGYYI